MGAPYGRALSVRFHGRPAHSGMVPEEGRSAIAAAARAIADLRLGRLDDETTANVGTITGGSARNIIPEWCELEAEARSHDARKLADLVQEMLDTFAFAASVAECTVETEVSETYQGYRFKESDPIVRLAATALAGVRLRARADAHRRRRGCERLQHQGSALPEPRERDGGDPHRRGAHRRRRSGRDGRRDAGPGRCRSGLDAGRLPRSSKSMTASIRLEVDGIECVAYPRLTGEVEVGRRGARQRAGAIARARVRRVRRPLREPDARSRARRPRRGRT